MVEHCVRNAGVAGSTPVWSTKYIRGVAQSGSASASGAEGRGFKSLRPDHSKGGGSMKKHGFTLIELLVVIVILAILVSALTSAIHRFKTRPEKDRTDMREHVQTDMTATNADR